MYSFIEHVSPWTRCDVVIADEYKLGSLTSAWLYGQEAWEKFF